MRRSGVLMHITSLPSPYGIGTLGKEAYRFVDFLAEAGQSCWQILPLGQTGFGDSPYQSCSTYAGNPYLIDLDQLIEEGYLLRKEVQEVDWGEDPLRVDYSGMYQKRYPLLRKAFERFRERLPEDYDAFGWEQGHWLEDYALFMAIKTDKNGASWDTWEEELRLRRPDAVAEAKGRLGIEMFFWKMVQYFFFRQWRALKSYANGKGISIIGDIPIYVAADSADVWANPWYFALDEDGRPVEVAGCPPDAFTEDGQLWGNPIYRWDRLQTDGYRWWMDRLRHNLNIYDELRIDHFRAFDSYYCIPFGHPNAKRGYWRKGPGMEFFRTLRNQLGDAPLIAEDLGFLTPSVRRLLAESNFPGMKVLQFAFGSDETNAYLMHHHTHNAVVYTGTHDNHTNIGWWESIGRKEQRRTREWLHAEENVPSNDLLQRAAMESVCNTCILTMQDLLGLGDEARMNEPSTTGMNWQWRADKHYLKKSLATRLRALTKKYDRLPRTEDRGEDISWIPLGARLDGKAVWESEEEAAKKTAESEAETASETASEKAADTTALEPNRAK